MKITSNHYITAGLLACFLCFSNRSVAEDFALTVSIKNPLSTARKAVPVVPVALKKLYRLPRPKLPLLQPKPLKLLLLKLPKPKLNKTRPVRKGLRGVPPRSANRKICVVENKALLLRGICHTGKFPSLLCVTEH